MAEYDFFLTLDNLRNIIYHTSPLIFKSHQVWYNKGFDICKNMIYNSRSKNKILLNTFALYYYISGFEEEHFSIKIHDDIFSTYHRVLYPKFFATLTDSGNALYVAYSINPNVPVGSTIKKINNKPFSSYLKRFMRFDSGLYPIFNDRILSCTKLFLDRGNPYMERPHVIELDNGKRTKLNYVSIDDSSIREITNNIISSYFYNRKFYYNRNNDILFITIPEFNGIDFKKISKLLPVKKIVVDIRDNPGGLLSDVENFYYFLFNLKISTNVIFKESSFLQSNVSNKGKILTTCQKCIVPKYQKIKNIDLTIFYNSNSRSICRFLLKIATIYIPNLKLISDDELQIDKICGNIMNIETNSYHLTIPTVCCCFKTETKLLNEKIKSKIK